MILIYEWQRQIENLVDFNKYPGSDLKFIFYSSWSNDNYAKAKVLKQEAKPIIYITAFLFVVAAWPQFTLIPLCVAIDMVRRVSSSSMEDRQALARYFACRLRLSDEDSYFLADKFLEFMVKIKPVNFKVVSVAIHEYYFRTQREIVDFWQILRDYVRAEIACPKFSLDSVPESTLDEILKMDGLDDEIEIPVMESKPDWRETTAVVIETSEFQIPAQKYMAPDGGQIMPYYEVDTEQKPFDFEATGEEDDVQVKVDPNYPERFMDPEQDEKALVDLATVEMSPVDHSDIPIPESELDDPKSLDRSPRGIKVDLPLSQLLDK